MYAELLPLETLLLNMDEWPREDDSVKSKSNEEFLAEYAVELEEKIASLTSSLVERDSQIATLEAVVAESSELISGANDDISLLSTEVETLQTEMEKMRQSHRMEISSWKSSVTEKDEELHRQREIISTFEQELRLAQQLNAKLQLQLAELTSSVSTSSCLHVDEQSRASTSHQWRQGLTASSVDAISLGSSCRRSAWHDDEDHYDDAFKILSNNSNTQALQRPPQPPPPPPPSSSSAALWRDSSPHDLNGSRRALAHDHDQHDHGAAHHSESSENDSCDALYTPSRTASPVDDRRSRDDHAPSSGARGSTPTSADSDSSRRPSLRDLIPTRRRRSRQSVLPLAD